MLATSSVPYEVLGYNKQWTSLFVPDGADVDVAKLAAAERTDFVEVWFDDDEGVTVRVAGADGFAGELSVSLANDGGAAVEDQRFIDALVSRKLLRPGAARTLKARLKDPAEKRDAWIREHGVEAAFAFPEPEPEEEPRSKVADGGEIDWTQPIPRRYRLPEAVRPTLDLHVFYWTEVWSLNANALYHRYRKHLSAADRMLADELCNAAAMGNTEEIPARVEYILQTTWQAEDWAAFIRSPKLDDGGTHPATARRWRELTGRG